jgi:hypothetical protein
LTVDANEVKSNPQVETYDSPGKSLAAVAVVLPTVSAKAAGTAITTAESNTGLSPRTGPVYVAALLFILV